MTGDMAAVDQLKIAPETETTASVWEHLREANRLFVADKAHGGRAGVIHAVWTILESLRPIELRDDDDQPLVPLAPLSSLLQALQALDNGNVLPLLEKVEGGVKASGMYESMKGYVAFVVRRLKKSKMPVSEAHKKVAGLLNKFGVEAARSGRNKRGRKISARTVRDWCGDVRADVSCHGSAALTCKELEEKYPSSRHDDGKHIDDLRRDYLNYLVKFITDHRCHEVK